MQIPELDIHTLSFVTVLFCFLFSAGMFSFGFSQKKFKGFYSFGLGHLAMGCSFIFIGLRQFFPDFLSVVMANTLIIAALSITLNGIIRFRNASIMGRFVSILTVGLTFVCFLYLNRLENSLITRIIVINILIILQVALCIRALLEKIPPSLKIPTYFTALQFFILGLYCLFRIFLTMEESPATGFMTAGTIHAVAFLVLDIQVIGTSFGYVWMADKTLELALTDLARIDPLTGILNRRALNDEAGKEIARVKRNNKPFSILLFDIDRFKSINDNFGHKVGDAALIALSHYVQGRMRQQDVFARYGGEEFLLLLPETPKSDALRVAERTRAEVEILDIPIEKGNLRITASFGVGTFGEDGKDWHELLVYTDQAMYQAKESGRNCVRAANHDRLET